MRTLDPAELAVPESVRDSLPPRPGGYLGGNELFGGWTGPTFDAIAPAATAASVTLGQLLNSQRAARLVQQKALDPSLPGLDDVLATLRGQMLGGGAGGPYLDEIQRAVVGVYIDELMDLASSSTMPQVQALASYELSQLQPVLTSAEGRGWDAMGYLLSRRIESFLNRPMPADSPPAPAPGAPPGSPIGQPAMGGAWTIPGLIPGDDMFGLGDLPALACSWN